MCSAIARAEFHYVNERIRIINQLGDFKIVVESYLM
jgi:hypothetical protein